MIKIGVFYLPDRNLNNDIKELKSFFGEKSKNSHFIDHIPHSTFYLFNSDESKIKNIITSFENIKKNISSFSVEIHDWIIFENDISTGMNTLCLKFNSTNDLIHLQRIIVEALFKNHISSNNIGLQGEFLKSDKLYGFPFVGQHWLPHITIGSLDIPSTDIIRYCNEIFEFPRKVKINNLNLFRVYGDSHELINTIEF